MEQNKTSKVIEVDTGEMRKQLKSEIIKEASYNNFNKTMKLGAELSITQINNDDNLNKIQKQFSSEITIIQTKPKVNENVKLQKQISPELIATNFTNLRKTQEEVSEKPFQCPDCLKTFSGRSGLYTHMKSHRSAKPFQCDICRKTFSSCGYLACHMKVHTGEKPFECDICHRTFANNGSLIAHKTVHAKIKPFKCEKCDKAFPQEGALRWHKKRVHPDNQQSNAQLKDKTPKGKGKAINTGNKILNYSEATECTAWMLQFAD